MSTFLGICVAFLGVCIAWAQWNLGRQKLVLDLFDKRYARYQDLRSATGSLMNAVHGNDQAWLTFTRATFEMEYLFGQNITDHMQSLRATGLEVRTMERRLDSERLVIGSPERDATAEHAARSIGQFDKLVADLYPLLMPYLRMDQKLPEGPIVKVKRLWSNRPTGD